MIPEWASNLNQLLINPNFIVSFTLLLDVDLAIAVLCRLCFWKVYFQDAILIFCLDVLGIHVIIQCKAAFEAAKIEFAAQGFEIIG